MRRDSFQFKSAVFKGESGRATPLGRAESDLGGSKRRPVRLRVSARDATAAMATIELSRAEAYAFSEWLDAMATQLPPDSQ